MSKYLDKISRIHKVIFLLLGILYYLMIQISIENISKANRPYVLSIQSHIPQTVKLHIQAKRNELTLVYCNNQRFSFPKREWSWFERKSEEIIVDLKEGENFCQVFVDKRARAFELVIKRKFDYVEYIILFIFWGFPLVSFVFNRFIGLLDHLKMKKKFKTKVFVPTDSRSIYLLAIICIGMLIRVLYFQKYGVLHFQHDWQGHVEFIKHISNHWSLPLGEKGLQFPQQPVYYLLMGGLYTIGLHFGLEEMQALHLLGYFALFCSFIFLYYGYKFFTLITENKWVQTVALLFISLTPSIVYMSVRINNDVLVMALSAYVLYYSVKGYYINFNQYFYRTLIGVTLLFMTKISAAPMEIFLFVLLFIKYLTTEEGQEIRYKLLIFSLVGIFVLGITLLKTYVPIEHIFHLVNSSGDFPGQRIESLGFSYWGNVHPYVLIETGYSYVFGNDTIRHSFWTYQYGTMFFGEFDYAKDMQDLIYLQYIMQGILVFGLVYQVGIVAYFYKIKYLTILQKLIVSIVILNLLLIIKFVYTYPVICNTDYRYFVVSFVLFAYIFAQGLAFLNYNRYVKFFITGMISLLTFFEVLFFVQILVFSE